MKIDWKILFDVVKALGLIVIGHLVTRWFERRAKLVSYYGHVSVFKWTPPQGNSINIYAHSVIISNKGQRSATNVRVNHAVLPDFNIWPSMQYTMDTLPDGSKDIVFPSLLPKEQLTISYLYFPPLTYSATNAGIKCDQGFAQPISVLLREKPHWGLVATVLGLSIVGIITTLYFLYLLFVRFVA